MDNLITITEQNGQQVVSAREIHAFLEVKENVNTWLKNQIDKAMLIENEDYTTLEIPKVGNRGGMAKLDYALTLSSAKEISMLNGGEKGKKARTYFLECEKKAKEQKPMSQIDILIQSAQMLKEQEQRLSAVETKVLEIQAKTQTTSNYFSVVGYATLNKISCGLKLASSVGRKASAICKQRNIPTESIPDPRFGAVKLYDYSILEEVFNQNIA